MNYIEERNANSAKYGKKISETRCSISWFLLGIISKKTRGITMHLEDENLLRVIFFFETTPSNDEIEDVREIEANVASDLWQSFEKFCFEIEVVPGSESLNSRMKNWGWVYLRSNRGQTTIF